MKDLATRKLLYSNKLGFYVETSNDCPRWINCGHETDIAADMIWTNQQVRNTDPLSVGCLSGTCNRYTSGVLWHV